MSAQRLFTEKYVRLLDREVRNGIGLERYSEPVFRYDVTQVRINPKIMRPEYLAGVLDPSPENDAESAVALYEAYRNLTPLQASYYTFWVSLAHTDLYGYVQERYPFIKSVEPKDHILNHWFVTNGLMYHSVARLWWGTYCTMDTDGVDKYRYTKFFFNNTDIVRFLSRTSIFRHKEAVYAILGFLMDNRDISRSHYRDRLRYIIKWISRLGAAKQLAYLDRDYFYSELVKIKQDILSVNSYESVKGIKPTTAE